MAAAFPGGIFAPTTKVDGVDFYLAAHMNDVQNEIVAIETEILAPVNGGRPNLLYDTLSQDLWLGGVTFTDFGDDTYVGGTLWNGVHNGQAPEASRQAGGSTDPFTHYFKCDFDSAASQAGIVQFLSAADSKRLRGKTVSISADLWGAAAGSTNMRMAVLEWAGTADALTSDVVGTWATGNPTLATSWSYVGTPASIAITSTRARKAVENLTLSSTLNNLAVFIWTPDSEGSTEEFNVARVKLEIGTTATDFVGPEFVEESGRIKFFYQKSYEANVIPGTNGASGYRIMTAAATNTLLGSNVLSPEMRITPTTVMYSFVGTANKCSTAAGADTGTTVTFTAKNASILSGAGDSGSGLTAGIQYIMHYTADARL